MAIPDGQGNVMVMVGFFVPQPGAGMAIPVGQGPVLAPLAGLTAQSPNTPSIDTFRSYKAPGTATLGALADAVAADQGFAPGGISLMVLPRAGVAPILEARATTLGNSVIPYGARVVVVPGS